MAPQVLICQEIAVILNAPSLLLFDPTILTYSIQNELWEHGKCGVQD